MAYLLKTDEILEALLKVDSASGATFQSQLEALASTMAECLAARLGVTAGPATFEGVAFAGTAAAFCPAFNGQPLPDAIAEYDHEAEWEGI